MRTLPSTNSYHLPNRRTNETRSTSGTRPPPRVTAASAGDRPIHASYDDLRRGEARQLLREQLTSAFPEAQPARPLLDPARAGRMSLKEKFMRRSCTLEAGGIPSAKSSSSTLDSSGTRRISMLPDPDSSVDSQAIDVERAIALLQELKKTASPNELVALHRALLPTKEVDAVSSPRASPLEEQVPHSSSPPYQRRSHALPPGLATRGGCDQDLLRRPEDAWTDSRRSKPTTPNNEHQNPLSSVGSFAALDLANDKAKSFEKRPTTPADFDYGHMGGWGNGALRVTNGAASPEPSIEPAAEEQVNGDNVRPTSSPSRPSLDGRRGRASIDVLPGRMSGDNLPLRDHNVTPIKPQLAAGQRAPRVSGTSLSSSAESPIKRTPPSLNTNVAQQLLDRRASVSPLSDLSTPGSTQRQSQRASDFSAEYMTDCGLTSSPYEDRSNNTLLNFASRLSTVYDSDTDDQVQRRGTPEAALLLLEGGQQSAHHETLDPFNNATTDMEGQASEAPTQNDRPPPPKKADSGYGSDASLRYQSLERPKETKPAKLHSLAQSKNLNNVEEQEETGSSIDSGSLYTFEEMVKSNPSEDVAAPSQPPKAGSKPKTRSPFLRLKSEKRSSAPNILEPVNNESKTTFYTVGSAPNSPSDGKKGQSGGKAQKKLQKPMPQAMKKQRKEEMLRHQESSTASLPNLSAPNVPAETSAAHARRLSSQPGSGSLDRTYESRVNADTPTQTPPVELDGEATRSAPAPGNVNEHKESPAETKTKDRGRKRSESVRKNSNVDEDSVPSRSWSISNLRNRSHSRGRSQAGKRSSVDIMMGKTCMAGDSGSRPTSPGDENVPAYSDFSSVARTLGGGSYDISTNQFKRSTAPVPSSVQHQLQSPWAISTGLAKTKQGKGMTPEMASEFARARSKDFANADKKPWQEQPRMVFPSLSKTKGNKKQPYRPSAAVEDFFPDWQSKPASRDSSAERPQPSNQKFSMPAETIPPLPELPADVGIKASRADQIVAKKLRSSPGSSARNSADLSSANATSGKKRSESLKRSETAPISNESPSQAQEQPYRVLHSAKPKALRSNSFDVQATPQNFSHPAALRSTDGVEDANPKDSAHTKQQTADQDVWVQQASFWRQRRQTLGDNLRRPAVQESKTSPPESLPQSQPSQAPDIVVSRYVTPLASENAARANAGHQQTALDRANSYRGLLVDEKENRPAKQDVPRTDSAVATPPNDSFVTVKSWTPSQSDLRPAKRDIPRTDSATSTQTYTTTSTTTTTSSTGRGRAAPNHHFRTPSGKFIPYSPSKESMTERSRARSQAPTTNSASSTPPSAPNNARKPLRDWLDNTSSANTSTSTLGTPRESSQPKSSPDHFNDRYSGGLDYGWERIAGFQGSAGTRSSGCSEGNRKSVQMSEQFGVDLSDVPVFLQRIR
ncbi:hypothetical protein D0864_06345 [Hortaea werneckii]|uniref:Uncharacterized protein n=1 Tax=Hortaea werneckii TaxID=91943 RepID=A0A3M7EK27_HORWE|nr:hypothetical protein D0862_13642 [Hortaea werneckii]RMY89995.1 hypothetical protein D0864_06345 [Hortaea werneckii]